MYACIYIYTYTLTKEGNVITLLQMEKQKQAGGGHRNCTGANCTLNNTQVYPLNPESHCHFGQGHPYLQDPGDSSLLLTTCLTRYSIRWRSFQELLIQLLLFDHSNSGARSKSSFGGRAHFFPPVLTLPKINYGDAASFRHSRNLQFSKGSGELQPAFSPSTRGPSPSMQVLQSQRHLPTCFHCARLRCLLLVPQESLWSRHQHCSSQHPMSNS